MSLFRYQIKLQNTKQQENFNPIPVCSDASCKEFQVWKWKIKQETRVLIVINVVQQICFNLWFYERKQMFKMLPWELYYSDDAEKEDNSSPSHMTTFPINHLYLVSQRRGLPGWFWWMWVLFRLSPRVGLNTSKPALSFYLNILKSSPSGRFLKRLQVLRSRNITTFLKRLHEMLKELWV